MDILSDPIRRAKRKANLECTAALVRDRLNKRLERSHNVKDGLALDQHRHDEMFALYLARVEKLKQVASMADSLINPVKIAALSALCILDKQPIISQQPAQNSPIAAYRNAYLALEVGLNILQIRQSMLPRHLTLHTLNFLSHLPHVKEVTAVSVGTDYADFSRRLTLLLSFFFTLAYANAK